MSLPSAAKLDTDLGDAAIYDVSHLLPRHGYKRYETRSVAEIDRIVLHKSGANGPPGYNGALGMARFCVEHRGWPGAAYHFWLSQVPDKDESQRLVIYRCNATATRSYHTGKLCNRFGLSIAFQGNYDGDGDFIPENRPTEAQMVMAELLVAHLRAQHNIVFEKTDADDDWGLTGHWEWGKPVCPGDFVRAWAMRKRGENLREPPVAVPTSHEVDPRRFTVQQLQQALALLDFDPGQIDGVRGYRTRAALESFQKSAGLASDGVYGPKSANALLAALRARGVADESLFADHAGRIQ